MSMKQVNEIRSQIGQLRQKQKEAEARLVVAGLASIGLSIGDRITTKKGVVEVSGCEANWGTPRPTGYKIKANGEVGSVSAGYIEDWEAAPNAPQPLISPKEATLHDTTQASPAQIGDE